MLKAFPSGLSTLFYFIFYFIFLSFFFTLLFTREQRSKSQPRSVVEGGELNQQQFEKTIVWSRYKCLPAGLNAADGGRVCRWKEIHISRIKQTRIEARGLRSIYHIMYRSQRRLLQMIYIYISIKNNCTQIREGACNFF